MAENAFASGGPVTGITGVPETVTEYRLAPAYVRHNLTRFIIFGALGALFLYADSRRAFPDLLFLGSVFSPVAIYNGVVYIWRQRFRTRLTTQGVEVRGYFNHFVPWSDVQGFEVGGYGESQPLGRGYDGVWVQGPGGGAMPVRRSGRTPKFGRRARLGSVHLVRTSGRRMLLRAPLVTSWAIDPYFDQKARQMQAQANQYGTRPNSQ